MAQIESLGDAQVILLAVQLTSDAEVARLHQLTARRVDVLKAATLYRILLTHLPIDAPMPQVIELLQDLRSDYFHSHSFDTAIDLSSVEELSPSIARKRVSQLRLQKAPAVSENFLTCFLIARAHQIEAANGDLPSVLRLIEPFIEQDTLLRTWVASKLLPLLRLQYEYYPETAVFPNLRDMERLTGGAGVSTLLQSTSKAGPFAQIGRDLRGVVAPWIYGSNKAKRRKVETDSNELTSGWADVNEWILDTSVTDFSLAAKALKEWDGPHDVDLGGYEEDMRDLTEEDDGDLRYQQTALAVICSSQDTTVDAIAQAGIILERVASLGRLKRPDRFRIMPTVGPLPTELTRISKASFLHNALLHRDNELTKPSEHTISFLEAILASLKILRSFKVDMTVKSAIELCLFGSEEQQKLEMSQILQQILRMTNIETDWTDMCAKLHWLQKWNTSSKTQPAKPHGLLWRIPSGTIYMEVLRTMLMANEHEKAINLFLSEESRPLSSSEVEDCVIAAIYRAYDNASNGNRTRGGMKRAFEMLKAFKPQFPYSKSLREIEHLIAAAHSLSFYQLTLQHGVPFQPVSIRVHKDPLALIDKVLEQNVNAYTRMDDLQEIARNIVLAGLPSPQSPSAEVELADSRAAESEHRIAYSAITSALTQHDFDTAYSYITTRLSHTSNKSSADDISWRAAYAGGRYRPPSTPKSLTLRMANLSKRMDLLSLALMLASLPDYLSEILDVWRACEEEMEGLKSQEAEEDRAWADKNNTSGTALPGGFGGEDRDQDMADTKRELDRRFMTRKGIGYEDEAPMGLFDVARGAAAAIQKSAFPLRSSARDSSITSSGIANTKTRTSFDDGGRPGSAMSGEAQRVRKRDMVSNAVTGGMLKGMSWVLGAEPVTKPQAEDEDE